MATEETYHEDEPMPIPTIVNKMKFKVGNPTPMKFEAAETIEPKQSDPLLVTIEDAVEYTLLRERHWMLATMDNHAAQQVANRLDEIKAKYS